MLAGASLSNGVEWERGEWHAVMFSRASEWLENENRAADDRPRPLGLGVVLCVARVARHADDS
jgi:hypothetical protein